MRTVVNVAEKPSIAKHMISALTGNSYKKENSYSMYNPVFAYSGSFQNTQAIIKITSVTGHIRELAFDPKYSNWNTVNPRILLTDAEILIKDAEDKLNVIKNLKSLSKNATDLFLWLDCDREGEAIAYEVINICLAVNSNLVLHRAKFSSVNPSELIRAFENPGVPNVNLSNAVAARQEVDLRSGAAFTRFQTNLIRKHHPEAMLAKFVSFGTCQFPTLSFIVDRFLKHVNFSNNKFWYIKLVLAKNELEVEFTWKRQRFFDKYIAGVLYEFVMDDPVAVIKSVRNSEGVKYKPYPLTTVDLQNLAVSKLKISSDRVMKAAERLYTSGCISYPRTETNVFSDNTPFNKILKQLENNDEFGDYIRFLNNDGFQKPRKGRKNDEAHPPIHPVKNFAGDSNSDDGRIYDLVARHFAACCSKDAVVENVEVLAEVNGEEFATKGLKIIEKNFLEVYDKYYNLKERQLPTFVQNETIKPKELALTEGVTAPPKLLTESDLITLMDKNGIGTDATIHEHIKTIQDRRYAYKQGYYFKPTQLGLALLGAYDKLESDLSNPFFRAETETNYSKIANGQAQKEEVVQETLYKMKKNFEIIENNVDRFVEYFKRIFDEYGSQVKKLEPMEQTYASSINGNTTAIRSNENRILPDPVERSNRSTGYITEETNNDLSAQTNSNILTVGKCPDCENGHLEIKLSRNNAYFVGCNSFPNCVACYFFDIKLMTVRPLSTACTSCRSPMAEFTFQNTKDVLCLSMSQCGNTVSNYLKKLESSRYENDKKYAAKKKGKYNAKKTVTCYFCKQPGHVTTNCPSKNQ